MNGTNGLLTALSLLAIATPALAKVEVSLITVGPGAELFESFGHSALQVRDSEEKEKSDIYEFRGLSAGSLARGNLMTNFLAVWEGKRVVPLAPTSLTEFRQRYQRPTDLREIRIEPLRLSKQQAQRLLDDLRSDMATGRYAYGMFNSNCATRVRDRLFGVLPAAIRAKLAAPSSETFKHIIMSGIDAAAAKHGGVALPIDTFARGSARVQVTSMMSHLGIPAVFRSGEDFENTLKRIDPLVSFVPNLYAAFQTFTTGDLVRPLTVYDTLVTPARLREGLRLILTGKRSLVKTMDAK